MGKRTWNLSEQAKEFFVYSVLGIVPEEYFDNDTYKEYLKTEYEYDCEELSYKTYCAFMCAVRAYKDLARTLNYVENEENEKATFKNTVYGYLANECLIEENISNEKIINMIEEVKAIADNNKVLLKNDFTYGQAQKWVNMTIKYLRLIKMVRCDDIIHIPVDSYIIDAFWENREIDFYSKQSEKFNHNLCQRPSNHILAWSKWNESVYNAFVNKFKEYIENKKLKDKRINSLTWEHENWIKISESRKIK
jgi:hypothetical protein